MISYNYEFDFTLENEDLITEWIRKVLASENKKLGEISYIFLSDEELLEINIKYLNHDYYTDIISFDYSEGNKISGDFFISIERIRDNAQEFQVSFQEEFLRVLIHGILHCCGYDDKSEQDKTRIRLKENEKIAMFHMEH